jgi:isoamylase
VHALRERQKRNFLATLLLSQGVPMLAHGDELGRTQGGNNNVYAQDNEISWVDWDEARNNDVLTEFTARLAALRAAHPVFRRQRFFQGRPIRGSSVDDIAWLHPGGHPMSEDDWNGGHAQSLAIFLNGRGIPDRDKVGEGVVDDSFLLLINAHHQKVTFVLPDAAYGAAWEVVVDTADPLLAHTRRRASGPGDRQRLLDRSMRVLRRSH